MSTTPQQSKLYASHLSIPYTTSSSPLLTLDVHTPTTPPPPSSPSFALMYVAITHSLTHHTPPHPSIPLHSLFRFSLIANFQTPPLPPAPPPPGGGKKKYKPIATSTAAPSATPSPHLSPSFHLYSQFSLRPGPGPRRRGRERGRGRGYR